MFLLLTLFEDKDIIIRSTDTYVLAIALINHDKLGMDKRKLNIHYGNDYCNVNSLVESIDKDYRYSLLKERNIPVIKMLGTFHFVTGSDDLSNLRGFSKSFCYQIFLQHCDSICGIDPVDCCKFIYGDLSSTEKIFRRFLVMLYLKKYNQCFASEDSLSLCAEAMKDATLQLVRNKTWHKTLITNNQMPTTSAINLHCKRIAFVLNIVSNATESELPKKDLKENGWKVVDENGRQIVSVVWDTMQTKNSIDSVKRVILRKCGCKKN